MPTPMHSSSWDTKLSHYQFRRKDRILPPPNTLWCIRQGIIRTFTWDEDGRIMTLGFWGKGHLLGDGLSAVRPYQADCLTPVEIARIPNDVSVSPALLIDHIKSSEELLRILQLTPLSIRLFQFLRWLGHRFGTQTTAGVCLNFSLTHQQIAEAMGVSRVTITRMMQQFERTNHIHRSSCQRPYGATYLIPDPASPYRRQA